MGEPAASGAHSVLVLPSQHGRRYVGSAARPDGRGRCACRQATERPAVHGRHQPRVPDAARAPAARGRGRCAAGPTWLPWHAAWPSAVQPVVLTRAVCSRAAEEPPEEVEPPKLPEIMRLAVLVNKLDAENAIAPAGALCLLGTGAVKENGAYAGAPPRPTRARRRPRAQPCRPAALPRPASARASPTRASPTAPAPPAPPSRAQGCPLRPRAA